MRASETFTVEKMARSAVLASLALIISYIELLIPLNLGLPGIKPGLANLLIVVCIYKLGPGYAAMVNFTRVLLSALLFGSVYSAVYAVAGAALSLAFMLLLKRTKLFSPVGVSMAGGVVHNLAQISIAAMIMQTKELFYYFPALLIAGMITGIINGIKSTIITTITRVTAYEYNVY